LNHEGVSERECFPTEELERLFTMTSTFTLESMDEEGFSEEFSDDEDMLSPTYDE
jgi:hypothetical protein